jgi:ABC-type transport system involved in multi-copper enzyme maturation permease subunit
MSRLLQSELIKLRTTRTFWALAGLPLGLSLIFVILGGILSDPTREDVIEEVFQNDLSSLFILILAIVGITGEWRHRTITSSLLAAPDRTRFLLAKTIAFAAAGVALSLLISVVVAAIGYFILEIRDKVTPDFSELLDAYGRNVLTAGLLGALGVGIGSLVRNQPTAIVGVLMFMLVIQPLLFTLVPDTATYSPLGGLLDSIAGESGNWVEDGDELGFAAALSLELAWIGLLFGLGAALLRSRDVE